MNSSQARRFERLYRRLWAALHRGDDDPAGLGQHERELLAHVSVDPAGVSLTWLTTHLLLPKSTASVLVKGLERRGFVTRRRDPADERRLRIALTPAGEEVVAADTVLQLGGLERALRQLTPTDRRQLLLLVELLAEAAEDQRQRPVGPRRGPTGRERAPPLRGGRYQ